MGNRQNWYNISFGTGITMEQNHNNEDKFDD